MNKEYPCKDCLFIITCRDNCPELSEILAEIGPPKNNKCSYCGNNITIDLYYGVFRRKCTVCGSLFYN